MVSDKGFEHTRHHLILWQATEPGSKRRYPVLVVTEPSELHVGRYRFIKVEFLLRYFSANDDFSDEWMLLRSRALGLLIDFTVEFEEDLRRFIRRYPDDDEKKYLLHSFAKALVKGKKFAHNSSYGQLAWLGKGRREAKKLLSSLSDCLRWAEGRGYLSGWSDAVGGQVTRDYLFGAKAAYVQVKNNVNLLSYIDRVRDTPVSSVADDVPADKPEETRKAFPEQYVVEMLFDGLCRFDKEGTTALLLAGLIIFFGGKRKSEPLHLWLRDVQFVDGTVWIFFHHPEGSVVIDKYNRRMRRSQVLDDIGYAPRNRDSGRSHAGWKRMAPGAALQWLPFPDDIKRWIASLFWTYIHRVRPALMKSRRDLGLPDHPYLLVANERSQDLGGPLTISAFNRAWKTAVKRLQKLHCDPRLTYGRDFGTTPHGGRHSYARTIRDHDANGVLLQRCLHQLSPFSSLPYGDPSAQDVADALANNRSADSRRKHRTVEEALIAQRDRGRNRFKGAR